MSTRLADDVASTMGLKDKLFELMPLTLGFGDAEESSDRIRVAAVTSGRVRCRAAVSKAAVLRHF